MYIPSLGEILDRSPLRLSVDTPLTEVLTQMYSVKGSGCGLNLEAADTQQDNQNRRSYHSVLGMAGDKLVGILTERDLVRQVATGKSLSRLCLADVITAELITLKSSEYKDIFTVLSLLRQHQIHHLPVVDEGGQILGLITWESLGQILEPTNMLRLSPVAEVMNSTVIQIHPDRTVFEAVELMVKYSVSSVVVVENPSRDGGEIIEIPVGLVTEQDIVQYQLLELDLRRLRLRRVMGQPLWLIQPTESLWQAHQLMLEKQVRQLVVMGCDGELEGVITQANLFDPLNPVELCRLVDGLQDKIDQLESEKKDLLQQHNQPLEKQVQQRTWQLQQQVECDGLLTTIADKIRRSLNLQDILNTTVTEIHQVLRVDRVVIYQFNPDWSGTVVAESVETPWKSLLGKVIDDPCFAPDWVSPYSNGRIRTVADVYKIEIAPCHLELLEQLQVRAKLLVPIVLKPETQTVENPENRLWGLLCANQCQTPREWHEFEINLLKKLVIQIAIGIQQSELHQQLETRVEDRTRLLQQTNEKLRAEVLERQRVEKQLRHSLKALSDIKYALDQSDIIAFTDAKGIITEVNDKFCQISQYQREELIGKTHRVINSGYHPPEFFQNMWQRIRQGKIWRGEIKNRAKDGSYYWVNTLIFPLMNEWGKPTQYLAIRTDITTLKNTEEELKSQNLKSRFFTEITLNIRQSLELSEILKTTVNEVQNILQAQRVLIYQMFPDGRGRVVQERVESQWESLLNQGFNSGFFDLENSQEYLSGKAKVIDEFKTNCNDFLAELKFKSQLIVPILQDKKLWGLMIAHQCDSPRQWRVFEIELIEQIAVQVGIALSQAELLEKEKELSELKSRFITMASHEFRTPLSLISSSAGILEDYGDRITSEKKQKHLHRIFSAVQHMTQLLDDVLTMNRAESDQFELTLNPVELVSFCHDLVEQMQQCTQNHQIVLTLIDAVNHTELSTFTAQLDENILQKVMMNLLSNAIKYSPEGGRIDVQLIRHNHAILFKVSDQGLGILPEDKARIFESFHRGKNVGTISGTGLGLAIVKKCLDLHQSTIEMTSEVGKGSTFIVKFNLNE